MNPIVDASVLMAVRNGMPHLAKAVTSVLNQTGPTLELIIIDDGSTDAGVCWLADFSEKDDRVRIIRNDESRGLTCSLNQALRVARGRYIARIDHDDFWLPGKLARQLEVFEQNAELVLVATAYREEDLDNCWQRPSILPASVTDIEIRQTLYCFNPFFHSSIMFRREVIDRIGGYNENYRFAQDYEMWTRILTCGRGHTIPDVLCVRRVGEENISIRKERAQRFNALRAKFAWCSRNGLSWRVITPALRDLLIVFLPGSIKTMVRARLHKAHSA